MADADREYRSRAFFDDESKKARAEARVAEHRKLMVKAPQKPRLENEVVIRLVKCMLYLLQSPSSPIVMEMMIRSDGCVMLRDIVLYLRCSPTFKNIEKLDAVIWQIAQLSKRWFDAVMGNGMKWMRVHSTKPVLVDFSVGLDADSYEFTYHFNPDDPEAEIVSVTQGNNCKLPNGITPKFVSLSEEERLEKENELTRRQQKEEEPVDLVSETMQDLSDMYTLDEDGIPIEHQYGPFVIQLGTGPRGKYELVSEIEVGSLVFTDRHYAFISMSLFSTKYGFLYLRCANDDRKLKGDEEVLTIECSSEQFDLFFVYYGDSKSTHDLRPWLAEEGWTDLNLAAPRVQGLCGDQHLNEVKWLRVEGSYTLRGHNNGASSGVPWIFMRPYQPPQIQNVPPLPLGQSFVATVAFDAEQYDLGCPLILDDDKQVLRYMPIREDDVVTGIEVVGEWVIGYNFTRSIWGYFPPMFLQADLTHLVPFAEYKVQVAFDGTEFGSEYASVTPGMWVRHLKSENGWALVQVSRESSGYVPPAIFGT